MLVNLTNLFYTQKLDNDSERLKYPTQREVGST